MLENQNKKVFSFNFLEKEKSEESNLLLLSRQNESEQRLKDESYKNLLLKKIQEKNEEALSSRSKYANNQKNYKEDENKPTKYEKYDYRIISKRDKIVKYN
jgi:hypothetical protein